MSFQDIPIQNLEGMRPAIDSFLETIRQWKAFPTAILQRDFLVELLAEMAKDSRGVLGLHAMATVLDSERLRTALRIDSETFALWNMFRVEFLQLLGTNA